MAAGPVPHIEVEERCGVPVFWTALPGPVRAALVFRVGRADEGLAGLGTTHLVEHLAMFPIGRTHFSCNAVVEDVRTLFFAEGTEDEVSGFLRDVTRALGDLPLDRLDVERRILQTEAAARESNLLGRLMRHRFGAAGPGLGDYVELGLRRLSEAEVTRWAAAFFTAGNAAVWMTGRPPPGLTLDLPAGDPVRPPAPVTRPGLRLPACVAEGTGGVAMAFLVSRGLAIAAARGIASERFFTRLREERGISYDIDGSYFPLTADATHMTIGADCVDAHAAEVRDGMQAGIEELAADGPAAEELEHYLTGYRRAIGDPEWAVGALDGHATDHLYGSARKQPAELAEELGDLSGEDVAAALREALATEILLVPEGVGPPPSGRPALFEPEAGPTVEGRTFRVRRRGLRRPRAAIVLGDEGVSLVGSEDGPVTIRFADCVAVVEERPEAYELIARDESHISFDVGVMAGGDELERAVRERVPAELFVPPDPRALAVNEVAAAKLKRRWTIGDEVDALPDLLQEDELPVTMAEAAIGLKAGLLVATDRRVLWSFHAWSETVDEYPYARIRSARAGGRVKRDVLVIETDTETITYKDIHPKERAAELAETIGERVARTTTLSEA